MASNHGELLGREPDGNRERRLFEILAAYFEAAEAGKAPGRTEWLARYPDWAEDIVRFLDDQDRLLSLTEPLRPIAEAGGDFMGEPDPGTIGAPAGLVPDYNRATDPPNGTADYPPGTKVRYVGDYELLEEIARGGMGVIFRARQRSLNRPVALKMLLAGALMSNAEEQRFRQEAEAAANLDHPNIVPIFEVGRHDGHSYFSMKLIEGGSLTRKLSHFAADQRSAAKLMATVARAVHHAHQRGVLHRDLKPSNILLSGAPDTPLGQLVPHVTDFGLAKRVEADSELTQSGAILGTPSYMTPEQASGKKGVVTVATDVYGLGAVLYAILAGRPPFQGDSVLETIAQVKDRALDPPSSHGLRVDRDLETICLKCLEKEPARRYPSAEAVAEDLERWMAGVPILARPASQAERAWRWCRRNPGVAALTGAIVLLVSLALGGLVVSNRIIAHERDEARNQRHRSERHAQQARRAVDQMYTRFAEDWLANQPRLEPLQYEFLAEALRFYEQFARDESEHVEVRRQVALAQRRVGEIQYKFNDYAQAELASRQSVRIMSGVICEGRSQSDDYLQWVECELALGRLLKRSGKSTEGEDTFRHAVAVCRKLAAEDQSSPKFQLALADALVHFEAEETLREAISTLSDLRVDDTDRKKYDTILSDSHAHLGSILVGRDLMQEAVIHHRQALQIRVDLARSFPNEYAIRKYVLISTTDYARDLWSLDRYEEALATYRDSLARATELAEQFPLLPVNRFNLAMSQNNLAFALATSPDPRLRDSKMAIQLAKSAVELHSANCMFWNTLGVAHFSAGDWNAAIAALEKSMQLCDGGDAYDRLFLAMAHWQKGNQDEAMKWYFQGVNWIAQKRAYARDLRRFRAEAKQLLGVADSRMPNGADAFRKE